MRKYKSLFDTTTLTISRKVAGSGFIDADDNWVELADIPITVVGDLQPYTKQAAQQINAPQGFTLKDAKLFSTKDTLRTVDDYTPTSADTTTIGIRKYFVSSVLDWTGSVLDTDYRDYVLVLQAVPDTGDIA